MNKHIVFDFDGTIVDSTDVIVRIYNELANKYNFKRVNHQEYHALMNLPIRERLKKLGVPMYRVLLIRKIGQEFKSRYNHLLDNVSFIDGIENVISTLRDQGYILSIITSNSVRNVSNYLESKGITSFREIKASNGLFGKHQSIKKYMKENRITKSEMIYIGDETRDIQACKRNSVKSIAVSWGLDQKDALVSEKPNYLIDHPNEIIDIMNNIDCK